MLRPRILLGFALLAFCSSLHAQTNQAYMNRILNARFVMVTTESGDVFDPRIISDDRKAAGDIQNKINEWKRFTLVYRQEDADIVIAVRTGGRFRANGGIHVGNMPRDTTGARIPDASNTNRQTTVGPIATADMGPKDDLFSVYDAHDYPSSALLWRREQKDGLGYPTQPLFDQFKKEVEKAAKKKP
jgi:hypothetical protein